MWFNLTTNQKAFALTSLLLTPGALAAAIPPSEVNSDLITPSFVADVPTNTHVPTTGADGSLTSDPNVGVTCRVSTNALPFLFLSSFDRCLVLTNPIPDLR